VHDTQQNWRRKRKQSAVRDKVQIHAKCGRIIATTKVKIPSSRRGLAGREHLEARGTTQISVCQGNKDHLPQTHTNGYKTKDDAMDNICV